MLFYLSLSALIKEESYHDMERKVTTTEHMKKKKKNLSRHDPERIKYKPSPARIYRKNVKLRLVLGRIKFRNIHKLLKNKITLEPGPSLYIKIKPAPSLMKKKIH